MGQAILDLRSEISNWGKAHKLFKNPVNPPEMRDPRSVSQQIRAFVDEGFGAKLRKIAACRAVGQRDNGTNGTKDFGLAIADCGLRIAEKDGSQK